MTQELIAEGVCNLLRQQALAGSDRPIAPDQPVGEIGLGLDSLALVSFVTALENAYDVNLPDTIWAERGRLTPLDFAELVAAARPSPQETPSAAPPATTANAPAIVPPAPALVARRTWRRLLRGALRRAGRLTHGVYRRVGHVVLARDLGSGALPQYTATLPLTFREVELSEAAAFGVPWGPRAGNLQRWIEQRFICLAAWHGEKLVGMDWLSRSGDVEGMTGLQLRLRPRSCYGLGLFEHPQYQGNGVGLSLLSWSLSESRRRGFERQVTMVNAANARMLTASIQLLGFEKTGAIDTHIILGRPRSTWTIDGESGTAAVITI